MITRLLTFFRLRKVPSTQPPANTLVLPPQVSQTPDGRVHIAPLIINDGRHFRKVRALGCYYITVTKEQGVRTQRAQLMSSHDLESYMDGLLKAFAAYQAALAAAARPPQLRLVEREEESSPALDADQTAG